VSGLDELTGLIEDDLGLKTATGAARQRHDTERAAMLAAFITAISLQIEGSDSRQPQRTA
jgi:hypothetical protein